VKRLVGCIVLVITVLYAVVTTSFAQVDVYSRLTDPRAIARLDNPDTGRLQYRNIHGLSSVVDSTDGYYVLAEDSGAGVLTHIWMTYGSYDSLAQMKFYIDGKLISSGPYTVVLDSPKGFIHLPFDTTYPGAHVWDVQVPYRKGFKISVTAPDNNFYYAICWRHIEDSLVVPSFTLHPSAQILASQAQAENRVRTLPDPWADSISLISEVSDTVRGHEKIVVFDTSGPAMIRSLTVRLPQYDTLALDSLWLKIYWDNSPYAAVDGPLGDFFCTAAGSIEVRTIFTRWDTTMRAFFPMPFASHARIVIENRSGTDLALSAAVKYHPEPIDRSVYGYFYSTFSEINPTLYHVDHHVLHTQGRGRYIGLFQYIPHASSGVCLEGDPIFTVDSNHKYFCRYTGGEDYYNSGWWFVGRVFSSPFAGQVKFWEAFYRFHAFDAFDFKTSFDFDLEHGVRSDNFEHYRTTAYYYKQTVAFWTSRDTIRSGERWTISGSGYKPHELITGKFDSSEILFTTTANANGSFVASMNVSTGWKTGKRHLMINGEEKPEPIYVLSTPALLVIGDFLPPKVKYTDTLLVKGAGFKFGERVQLYLDSILVSDTPITAATDYSFLGAAIIPNISDDWKYHLVAIGDSGSRAVYSDLISINRRRLLEFEDLAPSAHWDGGVGYCIPVNLSAYWANYWSRQGIAEYDPTEAGHSISFSFSVPVSDTFDVKLVLSAGENLGNYTYSLDGKQYGVFNGYSISEVHPSQAIELGTVAFTKFDHTITFKCLGKDSAAKRFLLQPDVLILTPTTKMPAPSGIWLGDGGGNSVSSNNDTGFSSGLLLYPNPVTDGMLHLNLLFNATSTATIEIVDLLGRTVFSGTGNANQGTLDLFIGNAAISSGNYVLNCTAMTPVGPRHITVPFVVLK
jgi:hypothetical protein